MKIQNINAENNSTQSSKEGGVFIATNLIKERETLDRDGNIIDPRTKQIIKPNTN